MAKASKRAKKEAEIDDIDDSEMETLDELDIDDADGAEPEPPFISADELIERVGLPRSPGSDVPFNIASDWINKVCNEEQRKQIDIYVYRTWPIIMRELDSRNIDSTTGSCPKHIDIVSLAYGHIDRAYMVATHGGGKYRLLVNDKSRTEKSSNYTLFKTHLDIPVDEADPKLNLKELVREDPKNRSYIVSLINKGIMNRDGDILAEVKAKENSDASVLGSVVQNLMSQVQTMSERQIESMRRNAPDDVAMQKAIELAAKGGEKSMDFMLAMLKDKKDPLELLVPLLGLIQKTQTSSDGLTTKDVLAMMQQQQSQQAEMFKLMLSIERDKREDKEEKQSLSSLIKDLQAVQNLGSTLSGNAPWYAALAESIGPILAQGLGLVSTIVAARSGVKQPVPTNSQPNPQTARQAKYPLPAQIARNETDDLTNPTTNLQTEPATQQTSQPMLQVPPGLNPEHYQMAILAIQQYGGFLLNALQKETSGDDFAAIVADLTSVAQVENIQLIGVDGLIAAMQAFPEYWTQVMAISNEKGVRRFLTEFCSFSTDVGGVEVSEVN